MVKELRTEIIIDTNVTKAWSILMDFQNYHTWNPFILSIEGKPEVGTQLENIIQAPGRKPMNFKPIILKSIENKEFRWLGKFLFKGLFDGEHYFKLEKINDNKLRFIHGEKFRGILIPLMSKALKDTERGFKQMNEAFKKRCESM